MLPEPDADRAGPWRGCVMRESVEERHERILQIVRGHGSMRVTELAAPPAAMAPVARAPWPTA